MTRPQRVSVKIILRMRVKQSRLMTRQNRILARRVREAKRAMTTKKKEGVSRSVLQHTYNHNDKTHLGVLDGAQTIATLSGNMT